MQLSVSKHTMVSQNISKMIWFIMVNPTPLLAYVVLHKQLMPTGMQSWIAKKLAILDPNQ